MPVKKKGRERFPYHAGPLFTGLDYVDYLDGVNEAELASYFSCQAVRCLSVYTHVYRGTLSLSHHPPIRLHSTLSSLTPPLPPQ